MTILNNWDIAKHHQDVSAEIEEDFRFAMSFEKRMPTELDIKPRVVTPRLPDPPLDIVEEEPRKVRSERVNILKSEERSVNESHNGFAMDYLIEYDSEE